MSNENLGQQIAKALLDEERLLILGCLAQGTAVSLPALAAQTKLKEGTLLRHVRLLQEVGLVSTAGSQPELVYQLDITAVQRLKRELFAPAVRPAADDVVARFVQNGRLMALPLDKNWGQVEKVMAWVGGKFEGGRTYTEKEIKEMLAHHAIDHATLRRYLVDTGVLQRNNKGVYWRTGSLENDTN